MCLKSNKRKGRYDMKFQKLQSLLCILLAGALIALLVFGVFKTKKSNEALRGRIEEYKKTLASSAAEKPKDEEKEETDTTAKEEEYSFKDKSVMFLGDGISVEGKYQKQVADLLKFKSYTNGAESGLFLRDMGNKATKEALKDIDMVILMGGNNDYSRGTLLGGKGDSADAGTFYGDIKGVIEKIKAAKEGVEIVFLTPLKHGPLDFQVSYPDANINNNYLDDFVKAIKEVAPEGGAKVIDLFTLSGIDDKNAVAYTIDNINLNDAGNEKIAKVIAEELNKMFK